MRLDYNIYELAVTGPSENDTIVSWTLGASGSTTFTHGLDDLTSLSPAFGVRINDSWNTISGGAFDWNEEFAVIPEPSVGFLVCVAGLLFAGLSRRRR